MKNVRNIDFIEGYNVAILEDYSVERWNSLAERTNTYMFIQMNGRDPLNYEEVRVWVRSLSEQNKKPAAATASSLVQLVK